MACTSTPVSSEYAPVAGRCRPWRGGEDDNSHSGAPSKGERYKRVVGS